jgi:hypothetical protein
VPLALPSNGHRARTASERGAGEGAREAQSRCLLVNLDVIKFRKAIARQFSQCFAQFDRIDLFERIPKSPWRVAEKSAGLN